MKFSLLACATLLSLVAAMPAPAAAPAPTARAVLPDALAARNLPQPVCASTKTLYGPYKINSPVLDYSKNDNFYAAKLLDGTLEIAVKAIHNSPFLSNGKETDHWDGEEYFQGSWGPIHTHHPKTWSIPSLPTPSLPAWGCSSKTTVVTSGQWGFPTEAPKWPELNGGKVRPREEMVAGDV